MAKKKVVSVDVPPPQHWVGDGFPVRSLLSYPGREAELSPFLLLDYAGPREFEPTDQPRGVGVHPHRGFETVTIVYQGEVAHRDSTGAGGVIGPGDVQWMTAASGILHDEFHSPAFSAAGGTLEMVQLWVNLPASDKMSAPRYQNLVKNEIPQVALPDDAGSVRVIAGEYSGHKGAASTFTPVDVWDVQLGEGREAHFSLPESRTLVVVVLRGAVFVNGEAVDAVKVVHLERDNQDLVLAATSDVSVLVLSGEPLEETVVGRGPFVMNTEVEIRDAIRDFNSGQFGQMQP